MTHQPNLSNWKTHAHFDLQTGDLYIFNSLNCCYSLTGLVWSMTYEALRPFKMNPLLGLEGLSFFGYSIWRLQQHCKEKWHIFVVLYQELGSAFQFVHKIDRFFFRKYPPMAQLRHDALATTLATCCGSAVEIGLCRAWATGQLAMQPTLSEAPMWYLGLQHASVATCCNMILKYMSQWFWNSFWLSLFLIWHLVRLWAAHRRLSFTPEIGASSRRKFLGLVLEVISTRHGRPKRCV